MFEGEGGSAFMGGGGAGGAGDGGAPGEPGGAPSGDGPTYAYPEGLDSSYHGNPTLLKHANDDGSFNQANIMKSLIHASSQMGADKMVVPNQNFTDDQWKDTFSKLGLPAELTEYGVTNNLAEGQTANEEMFNNFTKLAHENGILPKQAQAIANFYNEQMLGQGQDVTAANEARLAADTLALQNEWGDEGYVKNCGLADQALKHFVTDEAELASIVDSGMLNNSAVTKLFHRLGLGLQEDSGDSILQKGTFGMDNTQLDGEIARLGQEASTMGRRHPLYKAKMQEYQQALNKRHGNKPVAGSATIR